MTRSYNGWEADPDYRKLNASRFEVAGRGFIIVRVAQPLFAYLIRRFDAEVDQIDKGILDDWSFNYRKARAADSLSCHASATAVDLNATKYPMGRANMTPAQRKATEAILKACRGQFRWGGWFRMPYTDEMHFELVKGTSPASVKKAIAAMHLHSDGRVIKTEDLKLGGDPYRIKLLKKALARVGLFRRRPVYNGKWTPALSKAWQLWMAQAPKQNGIQRLDALGARTGLF
jgi:hypothetical protein